MFVSQNIGKPGGATLQMVPWPGGKVCISLEKLSGTVIRDVFLAALNEYERETPVDFVERTDENDYVSVIETIAQNSSFLGMIGGTQELYIAANASYGTILHELGHTVGLIHEHERSDRDEYINIYPENAFPDKRDVIERKLDSINLTQYDFFSIMHYPKNTASFNGENTIEPKEKYIHLIDSIGQRKKLSNLDKITLHKIYSFSPVAISPENDKIFQLNSTISFNFISTPPQEQYFLKIYADSNLQNIMYESGIDYDSRFLSELTINVRANLRVGDYFWRIETNPGRAELKYSKTSRFYLVKDLNNLVHQYPNPFNRMTIFEYLLRSTSKVNLDVFDILGQKVTAVISETQSPGFYRKEWDAGDIASGIYIYRFRGDNRESTGKLNIIK